MQNIFNIIFWPLLFKKLIAQEYCYFNRSKPTLIFLEFYFKHFLEKFTLKILGGSHCCSHLECAFLNVDSDTVNSNVIFWLHFMSKPSDFVCYFVTCLYCLIFYVVSHTKNNMEDGVLWEKRICMLGSEKFWM